jgi:hypothetical protein
MYYRNRLATASYGPFAISRLLVEVTDAKLRDGLPPGIWAGPLYILIYLPSSLPPYACMQRSTPGSDTQIMKLSPTGLSTYCKFEWSNAQSTPGSVMSFSIIESNVETVRGTTPRTHIQSPRL